MQTSGTTSSVSGTTVSSSSSLRGAGHCDSPLPDCIKIPYPFPNKRYELGTIIYSLNSITETYYQQDNGHSSVPLGLFRWDPVKRTIYQWYQADVDERQSIIGQEDPDIVECDRCRAEVISQLKLCPDASWRSSLASSFSDTGYWTEEDRLRPANPNEIAQWEDDLRHAFMQWSNVQQKLLGRFRRLGHPILFEGICNSQQYASRIAWESGDGETRLVQNSWMSEVRLTFVARICLELKMGLRCCQNQGLLFHNPLDQAPPSNCRNQLDDAVQHFKEAFLLCSTVRDVQDGWTPVFKDESPCIELLDAYIDGLQSLSVGLAKRCEYTVMYALNARESRQTAGSALNEFRSSTIGSHGDGKRGNEEGSDHSDEESDDEEAMGLGFTHTGVSSSTAHSDHKRKIGSNSSNNGSILKQELAVVDFINESRAIQELNYLLTAEVALGSAVEAFGRCRTTQKTEEIVDLTSLLHSLHRMAILRCLASWMINNPQKGLEAMADSLPDEALQILRQVSSTIRQGGTNESLKTTTGDGKKPLDPGFNDHFLADFKTQLKIQRQEEVKAHHEEHLRNQPAYGVNREAEALMAELVIRSLHLSVMHGTEALMKCTDCDSVFQSLKKTQTQHPNNKTTSLSSPSSRNRSTDFVNTEPSTPCATSSASSSSSSPHAQAINTNVPRCYKCQLVSHIHRYELCYSFRCLALARWFLSIRMKPTRHENELLQYCSTCELAPMWQFLMISYPLTNLVEKQWGSSYSLGFMSSSPFKDDDSDRLVTTNCNGIPPATDLVSLLTPPV